MLGGAVTTGTERLGAESLVSFARASELPELRADRGATLAVLLFPRG